MPEFPGLPNASANRLRITAYGLAVLGVGLILTAAMLLSSSPKHPTSGLWWILLGAGLGALTLSLLGMVLALHDRSSLLFGVPLSVALACVAVGTFVGAPAWFLSAASALLLVAGGGFLFAEPVLSTIRRLQSPPLPMRPKTSISDRQRISALLFQAFFAVMFIGLVASRFDIVSFDAVITAALVIVTLSLLLRLRPDRGSLVRGLASMLVAAFFISALYVPMPGSVQDAMSAVLLVAIAVILLGPDVREFLTRRRHRS